jgi:hypothetical protein
MRTALMFKRLGQVQEQEPLPVPAIMFKRLGQEASREEAPVTAIVFTRPVEDSGPSCSHSPPMPQPPTNHAGRFMGSPYFPYRW